jgi:hypothetical protein
MDVGRANWERSAPSRKRVYRDRAFEFPDPHR